MYTMKITSIYKKIPFESVVEFYEISLGIKKKIFFSPTISSKLNDSPNAVNIESC